MKRKDFINLTIEDIRIIFNALESKYGIGYSKVKEVAQLQAKLSIMLEVLSKKNG
jgi:hypothetical protein